MTALEGADQPSSPYPELTWVAVLVGYGLGALITVSIGYASLILGFSIEGSELAAILGWGVLRGGLRRKSIVENNINQTVASAVNGASAGMMFSVPALFILNEQYEGVVDFDPWLMILACITGGILGIAFIIPLRKQMIDYNRLAYPGGIAVAAVLKSPGAGIQKARLLLVGAAVSALFHLFVTKVVHTEVAPVGAALGLPAYLNVNFYLSLLTIGVGFLSGKGGLVFGIGGFLCYWLLAPLLNTFGPEATQAVVQAGPGALRGTLFQPGGIGILIGAALGGVVGAFPLIRSALKSMQEAAASGRGADGDELSIKVLYSMVGLGFVGLIVVAWNGSASMTLPAALGMAIVGTLWIWVAGVIVSECLGRTNWSPLSGMTLIAVTILVFVAKSAGIPTKETIIVSVTVGAAICVAIAQAGDMMLDLKSGYMTGAQPKAQQVGQFMATWLGPFLVMGLIFVLHNKYGLGSERLPAPQGQALASMVGGIVGGDVPAFRYLAGGALGVLLSLSGLGGIGVHIGLGFYMPFFIVLTYTIGVSLRVLADRTKGRHWSENSGIPVAAGLIVGEALVGVGNAIGAILVGGGS
ncbi:MAG: OPT/YSL family transporter [Myxococcota bacterium]